MSQSQQDYRKANLNTSLFDVPELIPYQMTILTTNTCTAECAHCSVYSSPSRKGALTAKQIIAAVDEIHSKTPLSVVIFAGGEPTLLGNELLDAIAHVEGNGIVSRVVTNGFWATSFASASKMLTRLREAGLREINISCDDFHLPFIAIDRLANAWKASKTMGFDAVVIANAHSPRSVLTSELICQVLGEDIPFVYDDLGENQGPKPPADGSTFYLLSNARLQRLGRTKEWIKDEDLQYPESQSKLNRGCPWILKSLAISPTNHLLSCCGTEANNMRVLDFGDINSHPLTELLRRAQDSVLVNAIAELGPYYLMQFAISKDPTLSFFSRYSSICEVCEDVFSNGRAIDVLEAHTGELATEMWERRKQMAINQQSSERA